MLTAPLATTTRNDSGVGICGDWDNAQCGDSSAAVGEVERGNLSLFVVYSVLSYCFTGLLQFVRRIKLKADLLGVASRKDRTYSALIIDAGVQSTEYGMSLQYDISTEKIRENMREWILYSTFS